MKVKYFMAISLLVLHCHVGFYLVCLSFCCMTNTPKLNGVNRSVLSFLRILWLLCAKLSGARWLNMALPTCLKLRLGQTLFPRARSTPKWLA